MQTCFICDKSDMWSPLGEGFLNFEYSFCGLGCVLNFYNEFVFYLANPLPIQQIEIECLSTLGYMYILGIKCLLYGIYKIESKHAKYIITDFDQWIWILS